VSKYGHVKYLSKNGWGNKAQNVPRPANSSSAWIKRLVLYLWRCLGGWLLVE